MAGSVIGALRVNLGLDSAAFSNGLAKAKGALDRFKTVAKVGLVAATAAASAIGVALKSTIDAADNMSKASQKLGIPIEDLSRLKYVADLSGVSLDTLGTGIKRLSTTMTQGLANPAKGAGKVFADLGVALADADGKARATNDVLADLADVFKSMPDGAEKTALAIKLFGRAGAELIPLLNGGKDALKGMMAEADQFGQVFSQEMGTNAERFNDNISRLQGAFGMLAAKLATALLPYLAQFTDWLVANTPQITAFVVATVEGFVWIGQKIGEVVTLAQDLWASFEAGWNRLIEGRNRVVAAFQQLGNDLVAALQAIPGQMIAIGTQIIDGLWQGIQARWESVKASITGLANSISQSVRDALGIQSPSTVMHAIGINIVEGLQNGMVSMSGSLESAAAGMADNVSMSFDAIGEALGGLLDDSKTKSEKLAGIFKALVGTILQSMGNSGLGGIFGSILKGFLGGIPGFANGGSFTVGGAGGIDSQLVQFKATPGERVDVTKPGQMRGGAFGAHITVGIASDGHLNLMPYVESVATGAAAEAGAAVARRVPSMTDQRTDERENRRLRPVFAGL